MESSKKDFSKFKVVEVYRNGPRFYVARLKESTGRELVLKRLLKMEDEWTKTGFRKELAFLLWAEALAVPDFSRVFPFLLAFENTKDTVWYATEYLRGEFQNREPSQFLLREDFPVQVDPAALSRFLLNLQALTGELPDPIRSQLRFSTLREYFDFIEWRKVLPSLRRWNLEPNFSMADEMIERFIDSHASIYDRQEKVLTHFEFYGAHLLVTAEGDLKVIDWENIGLSERTHDFTTIYLRAYHFPEWQDDFLYNFRTGLPDGYPFDDLFAVEAVLQSLGNLRFFSETGLGIERAEKEEAIDFFLSVLDRFIS